MSKKIKEEIFGVQNEDVAEEIKSEQFVVSKEAWKKVISELNELRINGLKNKEPVDLFKLDQEKKRVRVTIWLDGEKAFLLKDIVQKHHEYGQDTDSVIRYIAKPDGTKEAVSYTNYSLVDLKTGEEFEKELNILDIKSQGSFVTEVVDIEKVITKEVDATNVEQTVPVVQYAETTGGYVNAVASGEVVRVSVKSSETKLLINLRGKEYTINSKVANLK